MPVRRDVQSFPTVLRNPYEFAERPVLRSLWSCQIRGYSYRIVSLFSYVSMVERYPASHSLRAIRKLADPPFDWPNPIFSALYAAEGRAAFHGVV